MRLQRSGNSKQYHQTRKNYKKTEPYVHLSHAQRKNLILDVAGCVGGWGFARLFAECIDKAHFDPSRVGTTIGEQAFEQVVSRFERYLQNVGYPDGDFGMLIHDNNQTVAHKHTQLMKTFHRRGTLWTRLDYLIETPLFVDSELTSLVQVADLCGYALRRYLENGEEDLLNLIFQRADRKGNTVVGIRHFTGLSCACRLCEAHRPKSGALPEALNIFEA